MPALVRWPGVVSAGGEYRMPCSTLDYLPTITELLGYEMPDGRPIDGGEEEAVFDLVEDPFEVHNVISSHQDFAHERRSNSRIL